MSNDEQNIKIEMISDFDESTKVELQDCQSGDYPVLCVRNIVIFPTNIVPIVVGRKQSVQLGRYVEEHPDTVFAVFTQRDAYEGNPELSDLYPTGVFAKMLKLLRIPGTPKYTMLVQAVGRCRLESLELNGKYYTGQVTSLPENMPKADDENYQSLYHAVREKTEQYLDRNQELPGELGLAMSHINNSLIYPNFVATTLPFSIDEKECILEAGTQVERMYELLKVLNRALQLIDIQNRISRKTQADLDKQQKDYFLQQQIRNMRKELGDDTSSAAHKLEQKAKQKHWPEEVENAFQQGLERLETINPRDPDYSVQLNYLEQLVDLPWGEYTKDDLNLKRATRVLNHDHYGMEKVKQRILEFMAVLSLRGDLKSPIICLYGPPGVGKTSLGKSIARAMKRKYVRISLGGLHDEAEIRGHRRTYVGAMPGRIIAGMQKAGAQNPVFILDEIDKITQATVNGDPASALLEVLDPEQNNAFHDNYLDVDYDLSKVLFIATANDLSTIPRPLLDRMELIEVGGYVTEEKLEIAKRHLIPKELDNTGFAKRDKKEQPQFTKTALLKIIEQYTRESGVRQLEKQINKALRKVAYNMLIDDDQLADKYRKITPDTVAQLMGNPPFYRDIYQGNDYAGVVTGLAWTSVGGEILFIETSLSQGKAGKLTLTGNLGDVMKESAVIALQYVKAHVDLLGIDHRIFDNYNIHIHVPEGATPKDGPSAGITIATSIASALTQRKVRKNTAMTGEITLRGKVLPVGGIKEKLLAAKRAGITDIVMCQENRRDVEEIPEAYLRGVSFHFVENVQQVWDFALTSEMVDNPVEFKIPEEKKA